jgi:hypothetical protein
VRTGKDTGLERQRINKCLDDIDALTATNRLDYQDKITALKQNTDTSVETIETTLVLHFDELQEEMQAHLSTHTNRRALQEIDTKHDEVTQALDGLCTSIKDDLLTETKETLAAELDFDLKQDPSIKNCIKAIARDLFTAEKLDEARQQAMETQLLVIQTSAKNMMERYLAGILEPTERTRNPYNPVDQALKNIQNKIKMMISTAIQEIDTVIQGTVDQANEDVRLSTRSK